ncbi:peptide methionine sulfoxide reductase MsrA [Leptospira ryugenii]|uniref:Peptide methionine sulfoxide reductase MsrA n=1 Tax=Leptospira ryugenii TaxID=1917863 RepID=A0A2P2DZC9_9LEPT|nr:peptide methionine sulfoxide reductase MsrA [Leptospira ryugenii]
MVFLVLISCLSVCKQTLRPNGSDTKLSPTPPTSKAYAYFAEGCFWCSEHIFESIEGVEEVISGYAGGHTVNPSYEDVNTETTGHAETVRVLYDPKKVSFEELCYIFFLSHDPTTPDRQGPDIGNSYRSILFFSTENEKKTAESVKQKFAKEFPLPSPIVSEIKKIDAFYIAEEYHQDFIEKNPNQSYVRAVSMPRYERFKKDYSAWKEKRK